MAGRAPARGHAQIDLATVRRTAEVDGVGYYFRSANGRARFVKKPQDDRPTSP
jgi:YHS domain-containing protein